MMGAISFSPPLGAADSATPSPAAAEARRVAILFEASRLGWLNLKAAGGGIVAGKRVTERDAQVASSLLDWVINSMLPLVAMGGDAPPPPATSQAAPQLDTTDARAVVVSSLRLRELAALDDRNLARQAAAVRFWATGAADLLDRVACLEPAGKPYAA